MKRTLREALLGGPGLNGYAYNAAILCEDCGQDKIRELYAVEGYEPSDDTDDEPQPVFFGEADYAVHCDHCGEHCYGEDEAIPECDNCSDPLGPLDDPPHCMPCTLILAREAEEGKPPYLRDPVGADLIQDALPPYLRD